MNKDLTIMKIKSIISAKTERRGAMTSEAQLKAVKKFNQKRQRLTLDFYPSEADLWEHIQAQDKKQSYIKDLIRKDMSK